MTRITNPFLPKAFRYCIHTPARLLEWFFTFAFVLSFSLKLTVEIKQNGLFSCLLPQVTLQCLSGNVPLKIFPVSDEACFNEEADLMNV